MSESQRLSDGEMESLVSAHDWSKSPLGPMKSWSPSLRMMVRFLLANRLPMLLWWGPDYIQIYNDPYRPVLGAKHPWALGRPVRECWSEIWHILQPLIDTPYKGGPATWNDDIRLEINRHGFFEETHFTIAYSPVPDDTVPGGIGGVLATVVEITDKVVAERRVTVLRDLGARVGEAKSAEQACSIAAETLGGHAIDVPFVLFYLPDPSGRTARLAGSAGTRPCDPISPAIASLERKGETWPFEEAIRTETPLVVDLAGRFPSVPAGPWSDPPTKAVVVSIPSTKARKPAGLMVAGVSARLKLDRQYEDFLGLVRAQASAAIAHARAYEEERRRAEELARLDRAKTTFFSNVSHEFRTPLTLMMGPLEDGLNDTVNVLAPQQRERVELVRRNGLRLQKLVNSLLDFARIEAGRSQAHIVPTDLSLLTTDLASSFRSAIEKAGLEFVVDCRPLPELVPVDPSMWEKIVLNLLSNAFKFTFKGRIRIGLQGLGKMAELTVEDTGIGIPPDELPRIFERFHRVEGSRGRSHEGTGIGLALVQELVKLHGGCIDVESVPGRGTTFRIGIPAGSATLPKGTPSIPTLAPTGVGALAFLAEVAQWNGGERVPVSLPASTAPGGAIRILVADDNADMRDYIARILAREWNVETAADGVQALASAHANPPDLILSDVMMPVMDGMALLRALRADPRTKMIPIILLSARAGEEATIDGLSSGADEYLVKPFSANELLARVRARLSVSRERQEAIRAERLQAVEADRRRAEAEKSSQVREKITAVVSHDLRSPLSAIVTAAEVLDRQLSKSADEAQQAILRKHLSTIQRSTQRMDRLIGNLLDIASLDAGTFVIDRRPHRVQEIVGDVLDLFAGPVREAGVELTAEIDPGLAELSCDKDRIVQALANLVSNALKFTPAKGSIRLIARHSGDTFLFEVADNGRGIPVESLERIFDRYWHATRLNREGHGLGLAIVKGIVESHGGSIEARSEWQRGSVFTVRLPLRVQVPAMESRG